jgi:hypothetical protein
MILMCFLMAQSLLNYDQRCIREEATILDKAERFGAGALSTHLQQAQVPVASSLTPAAKLHHGPTGSDRSLWLYLEQS